MQSILVAAKTLLIAEVDAPKSWRVAGIALGSEEEHQLSTKVTLLVRQVETPDHSCMNTSSDPFRLKGVGGGFSSSSSPTTAFGSERHPIAWLSQHAPDQAREMRVKRAQNAHA